ncbi:AF4/FMR2 family member 1 [Chanos chanos]|uniref:AF4/FMR2 family member 1 n=1 Tax=Chanos chanos TaxID=29144 RepID=A0A6J2UXX6_CHACN|nr:AF4/FMR2 family member 1-like [Chanos chanos]
MAARPSLYNEDRDVLRRREWERRNQETQQEREFYLENAPLFGEPYKTNKGDELSSRIQRMLGNYEDVNSFHLNQHDGVPKDLPPPSQYGRSSRPGHTDKTKTPFQNPSPYGEGHSSQASYSTSQQQKKHSAQEHLPASSTYSHSVGYNSECPLEHHQRKGETWPDCTSLPSVLPALSPPAEPLSPLHSSDASDSEHQDINERDSPAHQGSSPEHRSSTSRVEVSHQQDIKKEAPLQSTEAPPLASQTFSLPLSAKPYLVMPPKPTAYVRPMDGQDQVTSESPDLKPSPEDFHGQSYENLPDLKNSNKPSLPPLKMPSQSIETLSNEVHCVEEILREMTHSWPPLVTAIQTPSTAEPSKFSFPVKESHVHAGYPGQKHHESSPKVSSSPCQEDSVVSQDCSAPQSAHSSGGESASSSDSESSSGSESDSESATEETLPVPRNNPPPPKAEGPAGDWLLCRWLPATQQSINPENQGDGITPSPSAATKPQSSVHTEDYNSHIPPARLPFSETESKPQGSSQHGHHKSPEHRETQGSKRKVVGNKHPLKNTKAHRPEETRTGVCVESVTVAPRDSDPAFTDRPKVKTKTPHGQGSTKADIKKPEKRASSVKKKTQEPTPKVTVTIASTKESDPAPAPASSPARVRASSPSQPVKSSSLQTDTLSVQKPSKKHRRSSLSKNRKRDSSSKSSHTHSDPLMVKIDLSLLFRVPQGPKPAKQAPGGHSKKSSVEKGDLANVKAAKKRPADPTDKHEKSLPKKKLKVEKESKSSSSSHHNASKAEAPKNNGEEKERKKSKKNHPPLPQPSSQVPVKGSGLKRRPPETTEGSAVQESSDKVKHKKSSGKRPDHAKTGKKAPKSSLSVPEPAQSAGAPAKHRPLLKIDDRPYPVEHHMKEAKKLKHKADAMSDKLGKAFNYLDAAMSFVESGIAMETDPQNPKSAYTMFSETLDLIKFILKLKNYMDPSAPAAERDFLVLCMRCQSLLQMAMFRYKRESALKYSKTLSEHFKSSAKTVQAPSPCILKGAGTPSPMSPMPSPASSASSGPGSNHSGGTGSVNTVAIPQVIQQVACCYVNITALFLSAHDTWEQAEELAHKGRGLVSELDSAVGQLSLTSSMSTLVRYTRQGLHWLRLDTQEAH